ncbi:MAG: exopolysaccharide biosynthesis polyprenyl glycosylphosphotransferase [Thermoleophilaceae bacterium]
MATEQAGVTAQREAPTGDPVPVRRRALRALRRPFTGTPRVQDVPREIPEGGANESTFRRDMLYRRALGLADALSAAVAVVVGVLILGEDTLSPAALAAIPMVIVVGKLSGLYDRDEHLLRKGTLDEAPQVFWVATLYTLLVFLAGDYIVDGPFGRDQALGLWGLLFASMLVSRCAARRGARAVAPEERCLVLGDHEVAAWLAAKVDSAHGLKTRIVGRVPLERDPPGANHLPILGAFDTLGLVLEQHDVDRVIIAPGESDAEHILDAIRLVKALGVKVSVLPRLFEVVGSSVEFDQIDGVTLLGVRRYGLSRSSWLLKRTLDVAGSLALLLVLGPLMLMIAAAIRLDTRGSVLFRQNRMGRGNVPFEMLKFRTMVDGADAQKAALHAHNEAGGGLFKIENDPRVTRAGRFLRRTSLDELPQLLNVLRGDMALVGPRPLVMDEDRLVEGWQRRRLQLAPGMTGLWQIFGSARIPLNEMVKIDYLYGANWSLWLDVKILLRTVPFVLGRRGL